MVKRLITAVVSIIAVLLILVFVKTPVTSIAVALLGVVSAYELFNISSNKSNKLLLIASFLYMAVVPFAIRGYIPVDTMLITVVYMFVFALSIMYKFKGLNLERQFLCVGMTLFVSYGFSTIINTLDSNFGMYYFFVAAFCALVTDTGAYFAGTLFGKHKLCPVLSPKKTVEGAIGGLIVCVIVVILYTGIYSNFTDGIESTNYVALIIGTVIASVGGMLGDLFASAVKRYFGVKDYGNFFPGHGGVLDRVDSLMFSFPIIYNFIQYFPFVK